MTSLSKNGAHKSISIHDISRNINQSLLSNSRLNKLQNPTKKNQIVFSNFDFDSKSYIDQTIICDKVFFLFTSILSNSKILIVSDFIKYIHLSILK